MKHTYHRISLISFPARFTGHVIFLIGALVLYSHELISGWVCIFGLVMVFIWGPGMLFISGQMSSTHAKHFEETILGSVEPLLVAIWMILLKFYPWSVLFALVGPMAAFMTIIGFAKSLRNLLIIAICSLVGLVGYHFQVITDRLIELEFFYVLASITYLLFIGLTALRMTGSIESTKVALEHSAEELKQINRFMQVTSASESIPKLMQEVNRLMRDWFSFQATSLCLIHEDKQELRSYYEPIDINKKLYRWSMATTPASASLLLMALTQQHSIVANNLSDYLYKYSEDIHYFMEHNATSVLVIPLRYFDTPLGCICLFSNENINNDNESINRISNYFNNLAIIISNHMVFNEFNKNQDILNKKNAELKENSIKLSKYLSPQIYEWIFSSQKQVSIGSTRKRLTFMIVRMKNYYQILDELDSEQLSLFVNGYLTCMTELIIQYGGTVDQYLGPQIRVFFGDPTTQGVKKDALQCLQLAIAMQTAFQHFKQRWSGIGDADLGLRIAISSGYTDVGNFGSEQRMNYTVIGSMVNDALRALALTDADQILITEDTFLLAQGYIEVIPVDGLSSHDKSDSAPIYKLTKFTHLELTVVE